MLIDCDTCTVRGQACGDCVVTVLLASPPRAGADRPEAVQLDRAERAAIEVLAGSGLVPPLRLVQGAGPPVAAGTDRAGCEPADRRAIRRDHSA